MNRISNHINYKEATRSITALRNGVDNTPNQSQLRNMIALALNVFEPLRAGLGGRAIRIASFFRCIILNKLIGGAHKIINGKRVETSQHCAEKGAAMDLDNDGVAEGPTNKEIFYFILNNLEFDQLIWEEGNNLSPDWVHVSYNEGNNRKQVLRCKGGKYYKFK